MEAQLMLPGMEACDPAKGVSPWLISAVRRELEWHARGTGQCYPKQGTLARKLGQSVRQIGRAIRALATAGIIERVRRGFRGFRSSLYVILQPLSEARVRSKVRSEPVRTTSHEETLRKPRPVVSHKHSEPDPEAIRAMTDPVAMQEALGEVLLKTHPDRAQALVEDPCTLIRWFGCCRRALRVGRNPPACLRWLWANRKWGWMSTEDEDRAHADMRAVMGTARKWVKPDPMREVFA